MPTALKLNLNLGRRGGGEVVGLDIQPGYVAAVQASVNGSILVRHAVGAPLGGDTVREGEVLNEDALTETLRELFRDGGLGRRVRIGVANQRTVLRTLELPPVTDAKELAIAVRFQAEDQVPMPLGNAVLDFQPLGVTDTPAGPRQRVIVVAAQRDMVERLLSAVRGAGLRPVGVDLSAFALIRSLYRADKEHAGRVLYLNVAGLTNLAIAEGTICRFTRVVGGGLESMASEIAEHNDISLPEARALLALVDLTAQPTPPQAQPAPEEASTPQATASTPQEAQPPPEQTPPTPQETSPTPDPMDGDVRAVLTNGVREIAGEVRNSLDFHRSQGGGGEVTSVVLSGPVLEIAGFAEALEVDLGVPVRSQTVGLAGQDACGVVSPEQLAVATGLAAEEVKK